MVNGRLIDACTQSFSPAGEKLTARDLDFPTIDDGVRGVRFIEKCVESSKQGATWIKF